MAEDPLDVALRAMRPDVDALVLRSAAQVRARGEQRTRRRRAALVGASALTVAVVVGGTALTGGALQSRRTTVPPATGSATPVPTQSPATTPAPTPTSSTRSGPPPLYATSGSVDADLFLPADRWAGPDLAGGHATRWQAVPNEGTVQVHTCDLDTRPGGDVGAAQVADAVTAAPLGTERVRTYASAAAARTAVADLADGLNGCQARLDQAPRNIVRVTVTPDPAVADGSATVHAFRVEVGTTTGGPAGVEWVALLAAGGGTSVATLVVDEPPATTDGFVTLRRLLAAAAARLTTAPSTAPATSPATAPTPTSAPPTSPTTTRPPTSPPTTTAAGLVLEPDGLGLVVGPASIRHLPFAGTTADQVTGQLTTALGSGTTSPSPDCGAHLRTFVSGGLSVLLDRTRFLGWTLQAAPGGSGAPGGPRTGDGLGVGSTLADLRAARPGVTVTTSTLGPEFVEPGGLSGLLDGTSSTSTVTLLRAGQTCSFR